MSEVRTTKGGAVFPSVLRSLKELGEGIAVARRTRRISAEDFSKQMGVSRATLHRLENGDPGCSLNTLASALNALGRLDLLSELISEEKDDIGMMVRRGNVPLRAPNRRRPVVADEDVQDDPDSDPSPSPYSGW